MPYPGRNNIYDAVIRRMVSEALEAQERVFVQSHGKDRDEALLAYLQSWAQRLGHTPWPREIPGGSFLEQRFGSWEAALEKAELPKPVTADKLKSFARYQETVEQQRTLYREKKAAKKQKTRHCLKQSV